ncbi:hypothetical protein C2845_PM03G30920 [Panicum miliaceum]|uniref:Uncharacterized protein n=1 Tax=Panicum miliaceum TaxID=4540 RepID=A0A3L6TEI2_PANMI|nr:hypothetical protein C2845_PM03G30920 [Panicum miliaceum]
MVLAATAASLSGYRLLPHRLRGPRPLSHKRNSPSAPILAPLHKHQSQWQSGGGPALLIDTSSNACLRQTGGLPPAELESCSLCILQLELDASILCLPYGPPKSPPRPAGHGTTRASVQVIASPRFPLDETKGAVQ